MLPRERTVKEWRKLAANQREKGLTAKHSAKKLKYFKNAIENLSHVPIEARSFNDWRRLAEYQNRAGLALQYKDEVQELEYYKLAINTRLNIPETACKANDYRDFAIYLNNAGSIGDDMQTRLTYVEQAIECISRIKIEERRLEDLRNLAVYQNAIGCLSKGDLVKQAEWFNKAIQTLSQIPIKNRRTKDWRDLASYQNNEGCNWHSQKDVRDIDGFKAAIESISNIPKQKRTTQNWRDLSTFQGNVGKVCNDLTEKNQFYEKAVKSLLCIPANKLIADDWKHLAWFQFEVGVYFNGKGQWKSAQLYFSAALNSHIHYVNNKQIGDNYNELEKMELPSSIDRQLYSFARDVFDGESFPQVKNKFLQLYYGIFNPDAVSHPDPHLHRLLQFMRLMEAMANEKQFPGEEVKTWLSDEKEFTEFKRKLKEVEDKCSFPSLFFLTEQSTSLAVAVSSKLVAHEQDIADANKEIQQVSDKVKLLPNSDVVEILNEKINRMQDELQGLRTETQFQKIEIEIQQKQIQHLQFNASAKHKNGKFDKFTLFKRHHHALNDLEQENVQENVYDDVRAGKQKMI